jgi:hypothetical protein
VRVLTALFGPTDAVERARDLALARVAELEAHVATLETALLALVGPRTVNITMYTPEETP